MTRSLTLIGAGGARQARNSDSQGKQLAFKAVDVTKPLRETRPPCMPRLVVSADGASARGWPLTAKSSWAYEGPTFSPE
jgi:hypothetical protein